LSNTAHTVGGGQRERDVGLQGGAPTATQRQNRDLLRWVGDASSRHGPVRGTLCKAATAFKYMLDGLSLDVQHVRFSPPLSLSLSFSRQACGTLPASALACAGDACSVASSDNFEQLAGCGSC
jgi:hypothetical protein